MEVRLRIKNGDKEAMSMGLVINKESEGMQKRKTCRKDSSQPLRWGGLKAEMAKTLFKRLRKS